MKVAVVGSRSFTDFKYLSSVLDEHKDKITLIVSGGAKGADTLAQKYAKYNGLPILIYYPQYDYYGKRAPFIRNTHIAEQADIMIAFSYKDSRGTKHVTDYMEGLDKPVILIDVTEPQ